MDFAQHSGAANGRCTDMLGDPTQRKLVLLAMALFTFACYMYAVISNCMISMAWTLNVDELKALPDVGHMMVPAVASGGVLWKLVDLAPFVCQLMGPVYLFASGKTRRFVQLVCIMAILRLLNAITQIVTLMPASRSNCYSSRASQEAEVVPFGMWVLTSPQTSSKACSDMIWSGHTQEMTLCLLSAITTLRQKFDVRWLRDGMVVFPMALYITGVMATRMHYLVDCLLAFTLAFGLYEHSVFRQKVWRCLNSMAGATESYEGAKENEQIFNDDTAV